MNNLIHEPTQRADAIESLQDRRQFLGTAAMGIVSAGAASLFPLYRVSAAKNDEIRPFPTTRLPNCANAYWRRAGRIAKRWRTRPRACS
jgi:hypothetical protein